MDRTERLSALERENAALRQENQMLHEELLRHRMERAVHDDQLSQCLMDELPRFFGTPAAPWFMCIIFHGGKPARAAVPNYSPVAAVEEAYAPVLHAFGAPYFFEVRGDVVCLLNLTLSPNRDPEATGADIGMFIKTALEKYREQTSKQTGVSHISMSHISKMKGGPRMLYRSASDVAERRTTDSEAVCTEYELTDRSGSGEDHLLSLELIFWRQVQQHTFFDAATTLDRLIAAVSLEQGSLERTLASVFSRMELVLHTMIQENGTELNQSPDVSQMLSRLSQVKTYQEMRDIAYDILATLEDLFFTPQNTRNKKMPAIERYIKAHYMEQSMGAAALSLEFRISTSYLSRIFKADMGVSVVDYIHSVRISAAKELLRGTADTLDEIALQTGFSNRWVFMRVFKKLEGMTPGEFRQHCADNRYD